MDFHVDLDPAAPTVRGSETFVLERDGGRRVMRIHDYDDVYAVPGLYEHVVSDRLGCVSPQTLATSLAAEVTAAGEQPADVRCLDVGAGNGVSGAALRDAGLTPVVGLDVSPAAGAAAERDRPGLYAEFVVAALGDAAVPDLVTRHRLTALVSAGALTGGHIEPQVLARTWAAFAPGGWLAYTCAEAHADDARSIFAEHTDIRRDERFVHRRTVAGDPVWYRVLVGRRR
ncbi:class I SAM-dependent DNA methyltransferase [uncultured Jatrophihabitans sp.]|uniref:class I SAM-dependent DNA methyltransferase n=1 Tax=uncultured Jatrophihabitans sp. TaxID=1610747 RepID=UPI0035CC3C7D